MRKKIKELIDAGEIDEESKEVDNFVKDVMGKVIESIKKHYKLN